MFLPAHRLFLASKNMCMASSTFQKAWGNLFGQLRASYLQADTTLSKANRASAFDAGKNLRAEIISHGMESSISSGNWSIKRFRMERKGVTQAHLILTILSFLAIVL